MSRMSEMSERVEKIKRITRENLEKEGYFNVWTPKVKTKPIPVFTPIPEEVIYEHRLGE